MLQRRRLLQLGAAAIALRTKRSLPAQHSTPKFWFGDQVYCELVCDDDLDPENFGRPLVDHGVVIGLFFTAGNRFHRAGWNYFIHWTLVDGEAVKGNDWDSVAHESDLKRVNQPPRCC